MDLGCRSDALVLRTSRLTPPLMRMCCAIRNAAPISEGARGLSDICVLDGGVIILLLGGAATY